MNDQNTLKMNNKPSKGIPVSKIPTSGRDSGTHSRSSSVSNLTTASDIHSEAGDAASENAHDFKLGEKVWVNGTKPGCIKFIGKTQFAPGIWAGIILDEPVGKNDGSVAGVKYFECEPLKGIFARPQKLTRSPGTVTGTGDTSNTPQSSSRPGASIPSSRASVCSSIASTPRGTCSKLRVGERVVVSSTTGTKAGTLRFVGETEFAKGEWAGIELDEPVGKNDGSVAGKRYFSCPMKYGLFSPLHKVSRAGGASVSRPASVRGTPLMRSGSRDSLSSSVSNSSRASRVKLGITSLTNSQRSRVPGSGLMINTSGLEEALKEKEQHIEQLLKERENERAEVARVASHCEEIERKFSEQKDLLEKTNLLRKSLDGELAALKRKYEDVQFQLEEEKITKSDFEMQLSKRNVVFDRLEEFLTKDVSNAFVPVKEILEGQEKLSEVSVKEESNQIAEELKSKIAELENGLKNITEEKNKITNERDEFQKQLCEVENKHKDLLTGLNEKDMTLQEKDNLIGNLKEELNSQLEKVTKLMDDNKALNEQVIMQAELAKGQADDVIKELGEKVNLLTEDVKVKSNLLEEKAGLIQDKDNTISTLQQKLESQSTCASNLECENKNLNQVLGLKDSELSEKTAMQKCLEDTIASLKSELEIAKNEEKMLGLVKEIERLTNCLQEKEDELVQQQNKVTALQSSGKELNEEMVQLKEKLQDVEKNNSLSSKNNVEQTEALVTQLKQLKDEKDHIRDEYEKKLQSAQEEVKMLTSELVGKNDLLSAKESEFASLTENLKEKELKCTEIEKLIKEIDDTLNLLKAKEQLASDLKEETEKLKALLDEKNNEVSGVKEELNSLKETSNQRTDENKQLLSKLELADQKIAMLNKDSSDHVMSLQDELTKLKEEGMAAISHKEQELMKLKNENERLTMVSAENAEKLKEKENIVNSTMDKLNEKDAEMSGLSNKLKQLEQEISSLNEDKEEGKAAHHKDLENIIAKHATELKDKEGELQAVHAELKQYAELAEKNNKELKRKEGEISALKNIVNEKEMQFDELSQMIEASQAQLVLLKKQDESNVALLNSKESYIKDFMADQEKQLQQKEQVFKNEIAKLEDVMNMKEAEIKKQENTILNLSSQEEKRKEQIKLLELDIENMKSEKDGKVNEFNDVCADFNKKIAALEEKYSKLILEKEEIAKEELKTRDAKKNLEVIRDTLLKEKTEQEEIVKDKETKLEALLAEVNRMRLEFMQHKHELQQKLDVSEMEVQAALELKKQLELQHSVLEELQQELQNSEEKCKSLELQGQSISAITSERNELQSKIEAFEKLNQSISERANEIEKKNQSLEEHLSNNKNILMQKETDITNLTEKLQALQKIENSSESLKLALDSTLKENALLKNKIASLEAASVAKNADATGGNANEVGDDEDKESLKSQIDFLNSIIVDMKQKNEDLSKQLEIATTCWDEPDVNLNGAKKTLAPRLFCDICDMFDLHDTDDCPKQESFLEEEVPNLRSSGPRKFEERPYCNNCECFGHWTLDCSEPETF